MKPSLLEHYTELAQHHREKLSFLGGLYLALGQVLIFTPTSTLEQIKTNLLSKDQLVPDIAIFGGSAAALFTLITVGILHHLCNLIAYATLRLNYERRCVVEDVKRNTVDWEKKLEAHLRTRFSLSKVSGVLAITCAAVIWASIVIRIIYIFKHLFADSPSVNVFVGLFIFTQIGILIVYAVIIFNRGRRFYQARDILKCIETDASIDKLIVRLQHCDIPICQHDAELYKGTVSESRST